MTSTAAIYARQSVDHAEGMARQVDRCTKLIAERGWQLGQVYEDNETSAIRVRGEGTGWAAMLDAVGRGEVDIIVAVDMDRLLRSLHDLSMLIDLHVKVVTVDGEIDLTSADGEFRAGILASIAAFETRRKSERQIRANEYRVANGLPVAGGRRRFGFESDHVTIVPSESRWIRRMYEEVASGASLGSISRELNEAGVPCVVKGLWSPARVRKILVNPAYSGFVIHHRRAWASDKVPPIVDIELAERVAAIMADPSRRKASGNERTALLGGLAICGTCGARLISAGTKSRGIAVQTYACSRVKAGQTSAAGHPSIRRHIVDGAVRQQVVNAFMFGRAQITSLPSTSGLQAIEANVAKLHSDRADLIALVGDDTGITQAEIRPRLVEIAQQLEALDAQRVRIVAADAHAQMLVDAQRAVFEPGIEGVVDAVHLHLDLLARFDLLSLDLKRMLVRSLVEVTVHPGRGADRVQIRHLVATSLNEEIAKLLSSIEEDESSSRIRGLDR